MMRNEIPGILAWLVASIAVVAPAADAGEIPSYYDHLDFNLTSPTAWTTASGGFANPGVYAIMPGEELEYYWSDVKDDPLGGGLHRWGIFLGLGHVGFGAVHDRAPAPMGGYHSVTDYRLALSGGRRESTFGIGLGWSRGNTEEFARTTVVQLGAARRFGRFLSFGAAGIFSTEKSDQSGLIDLAVRPSGDQRLTLFGDVELPHGVKLEDAPWSAGAMLEVPAGIKVVGRYFENESFTVGVAVSFGGVNAGVLRGLASGRYDSDNDLVRANYGVRVGFPERNTIADWTDHDRYLRMELKGPIVHQRFKYFDERETLWGVLAGLEAARADDRVSGVVLNLAGSRLTLGHAWEIRRKLEEIQAAGKPVVVFMETAGMSTYYLASVADHIVIDPEGFMLLPGYVRSRTYVRGVFDKLGVGVEEIRFKDYKSAAEFLVRTDMSDEDREQRQALVDQYYETVRSDVAASRGVGSSEFDRWVNELTLMTPASALEEGLVDTLGRWDEAKDIVEAFTGDRKRFIGRASLGDAWYPSTTWGTTQKIAVVYAVGPCAMENGINARRLQRQLRALSGRDDVKAIVLRVNSPGGDGMASDVVAEAVKKATQKKPVVVSMGDVAASGGYWVSIYADEVLAQPTTIAGSIGVIGAWVWDEGFSEKIGLSYDFVKAGERADLFSPIRLPLIGGIVPHRPLTDAERARVLAEVERAYDGFVAKVATGRGMEEEDVELVAKGRVWTGVASVEKGLVDGIGGLDDAIRVARRRAGIGDDEEVEILDYSTIGFFDLRSVTGLPFTEAPGAQAAFDLISQYDLVYLRKLAEHSGRPLYLLPPEFVPRPDE